MKDRIKRFYDEHSLKQLAGYVHGNRRLEAAIRFSLEWIPGGARRILDVGCGIGWSSWEIKRNFPEAFVLGLDLSDKVVEIAKLLFENEKRGIKFIVHDITEWNELFEQTFDAILFLDSYEHIPASSRPKVHKVIKDALTEGGVIILTFPSLFHQRFLRTYHKDRLQPVDEDVTYEDIGKIANDIGGTVIYYAHKSIWNTNDYVHAVIKKINGKTGETVKRKSKHDIQPKDEREKRVTSRLKVRVTREGVVFPIRSGPKVCIVTPNRNAYSETFIRAHIERLPTDVMVIYGNWEWQTEDGENIPPIDLLSRGIRYLLRTFVGIPQTYFSSRSLAHFIKSKNIKAVLAEYGTTGVNVMRGCKLARVPLVVHFHGFDAHDQRVLERYEQEYRKMFQIASAIIVVSREMGKQLLNLGAPENKVFYNPCGVDVEIFKGADPASSPPVFISVARFADKKAPYLTLLSFEKVLREFPSARLIMVGDGPLMEASINISRVLKIDHAVEFCGVRSHTEVAEMLRKSRAFVLHSITTSSGDREGTPVAVLEACASGLPVVSTRHAGIKDVIEDGENGFLVEERDIQGMAQKMLLLAKNPHLAAELGRKARERVKKDFSMEKSINRLWEIIEDSIRSYEKP